MIWNVFYLILALISAIKMDPNISFGACEVDGVPIILNMNSAERILSGNLEGEISASNYSSDFCVGYLPLEPQFCISIASGGGNFIFEVTDAEQIDTVLVLVGEEEIICDDDGGNSLLSRISYQLGAGQYQLYVGSYSQGNQAHFTLQVSASGW